MRILLSAYSCEPNPGSEPGFGWNWAWYLAEQGHDVIILTRSCARQAIECELMVHSQPRLRFEYIEGPSYLLKHAKRLHYIVWQWLALDIAKRMCKSFDIVHHVTFGTLFLASELWRTKKPFVLGPVGGGQMAPRRFSRYWGGKWYKEQVRNWMHLFFPAIPNNRRMLRNTALVLVTNQETEKLARGMGAKRVIKFLDTGLPDWYILDKVPIKEDSEILRILWVGRIIGRKALPLVLDALSKVSIPFELTILGDGSLSHKVPSWIRQYDLTGKVHYPGSVPWLDVKSAYKSHDVFLFTSLRDSFGAQLLEAMAHGLPIITLDHHGARDFVPKEASIKAAVTDPEKTVLELSEAIEKIADDSELRTQMGKAGLDFAKTQTWTRRAKRMSDLYAELLEI